MQRGLVGLVAVGLALVPSSRASAASGGEIVRALTKAKEAVLDFISGSETAAPKAAVRGAVHARPRDCQLPDKHNAKPDKTDKRCAQAPGNATSIQPAAAKTAADTGS